MAKDSFFSKLLGKGTAHCNTDQERRLVRTMNFIFYALVLLIFPLVIINNILVKDYVELMFLAPIIIIVIWLVKHNQKGYSQRALIISSLLFTSLLYPIVYVNDSQMGAPYVALLVSFLGVVFIKNALWRNVVFFYGFVTFVTTNTFQLLYRPFDLIEHLVSLFFVCIVFLIFRYVGKLQNTYEAQLEKQNIVIKEQSEALLESQKKAHEHELQLKRKDMEAVVANNLAQVQIKENLIDKLRDIESAENSSLAIKKIIIELKQQIDTQKKINLHQENIEEVNAQFVEKLHFHAPNISKTETELSIFLRLGLSTKEIASLKNTSSNTINVTKTRLRNKLGLQTNAEIASFLRSL